ncbi:MAG TPA: sterol desaturase family protein [Rhodocyclaceae bacterium]|nr:sterol desaturase family protein [Rhodocyclaceae bacterium]
MNRHHWLRLGVYLFFAALMMLTIWYASAELSSIKTGPLANFHVTIFGFTLTYASLLERVFPLIAIVAAVGCDYFLDRKKGSSFAKVLDDVSTRNDLITALFANVPILVFALTVIFTFGLIVEFDKLAGSFIPHDLNLFDKSVAAFGFAATAVIFFLVMTFFDYWRHRLQHTQAFFTLHRFHHSATKLTGFSAYRSHPAENIIHPFFVSLPMAMMGAPADFLLVYSSLILFHGLVVHGDNGVDWGWFGRYVICDPRNHRVHHSSEARHFNKNLCTITPIWDKLFGTYCYEEEPFDLGVKGSEHYSTKNFFHVIVIDLKEFIRETLKKFESSYSERPGV